MKQFFVFDHIRVRISPTNAYRPACGFLTHRHGAELYLGWLTIEYENYPCAMTRNGVVHREQGVTL